MRLILLTAQILLLLGCVNLGPRVMEAGRAQYNVALQRTDDQQLLLNIVRLRYRDRPYFLEVSAVATQFNFVQSVGALAAIGSPDIEQDVLANGSVTVEEQPTVTYTPLQGTDFAHQMLTPISLNELILLSQSGWSIERILRVAVQRLNGLANAPTAAGPTPDNAPAYESFQTASRLLGELQNRDVVFLGRRHVGDQEKLFLRFSDAAVSTEAHAELLRLLELEGSAPEYEITADPPLSANVIRLQTRSFLAMMYYLAQSVEISPADWQQGTVTLTRSADDEVFDWSLVTEGLMTIRSSEQRPLRSAVEVRYRDRWFYIDDTDLDGKSTFSLLGQLFSLTADPSGIAGPLLTLPVGN